MITTSGDQTIGTLIATQLGGFVAIGVGGSVPNVNDEELDFEVLRLPIRSRTYDANTRTVTYTSTVPENMELVIAEVGIVSAPAITPSSGMITAFSEDEMWTGGTQTTVNSRVGGSGLNIALETVSSIESNKSALSDIKLTDQIQVAYHGAGGSVEVRFENTPTDYYGFTFTPAAGYNVYKIPVGQMTKVGGPDLSGALGVTIIHSGSGSVTMDAIRINSKIDDERLLVRQRFVTPYTKIEGMPLDIEIPVVIN